MFGIRPKMAPCECTAAGLAAHRAIPSGSGPPPSLVVPILVLLLQVPTSPLLGLGPEDLLPELPGSVIRSTERSADGLRFVAELRIPVPADAGPAEIGDLAVEAAHRCLERMESDGWSLVGEAWQRRGGVFEFLKDVILRAKVTVGPTAKPIEGRMQSFVGLRFELQRRLPFHDVKGCDPPDVPRFPGSVRVRWMNLLGDFATKYLVVAPLAEVRAFFERELPEHGWTPGRGAGTLNYVKGGFTEGTGEPEPPSGRLAEPLELARELIPTTLSIALSEKAGLVEIGIGRAAGGRDPALEDPLPVTPARGEPSTPNNVLTAIDPERDLPVPPGLSLESKRREPSNPPGEERIRRTYVEKQAPMAKALEVADFYRGEMSRRGWTLEDEEWYGIGRELRFRKGAVGVHVSVKAVGRYPLPERQPTLRLPVEVLVTLPVPERDVAGEDIPGVPRFPGSVRFYHLQAATDHVVKFKAVGSVDEAEWFFIDRLPENGWTFAGNDSTGLLFVPSGTARSPTEALASGELIPTTLRIKVDDEGHGVIKIGMDRTRGG